MVDDFALIMGDFCAGKFPDQRSRISSSFQSSPKKSLWPPSPYPTLLFSLSDQSFRKNHLWKRRASISAVSPYLLLRYLQVFFEVPHRGFVSEQRPNTFAFKVKLNAWSRSTDHSLGFPSSIYFCIRFLALVVFDSRISFLPYFSLKVFQAVKVFWRSANSIALAANYIMLKRSIRRRVIIMLAWIEAPPMKAICCHIRFLGISIWNPWMEAMTFLKFLKIDLAPIPFQHHSQKD